MSIVASRMLSSVLALILTIMYLNHSCSAKSLQFISPVKNNLVAHSLKLLQNSEFESDKLFCLSTGCVKIAATLINNMDQSVDPCDDFYQFACGNFIKNTYLDEAEYSRNALSMISDTVFHQMRMIMAEPIKSEEPRPFKMTKLLFQSCMDREHIEKLGLGPIMEILKSVGGWPVLEGDKWNESKFTWMDSTYKFIVPDKDDVVDNFMQIMVARNLSNPKTNILYIDGPTLGHKQEDLVQGKDHDSVNKYYKYMVDIAVLFGADRQRATEEMRESLDLEIELAKMSMAPKDQLQDLSKLLNPMKIADLQEKFPILPWQEFLSKVLNQSIRKDDIIVVPSLKYLLDLQTLLSKTPKRVQANYIIWRYVLDSLSYLTEDLKKRQIINSKNNIIIPRWKECAEISFKLFDVAIGSMYVRHLFDSNAKENVLEMVNGIKGELNKILSSNEWMDDETRKHAIDKERAMTYNIAYPDELLDDSKLNAYYENLEVNGQDYYTSVLNLTKFRKNNLFSKLWKPEIDDWISFSSSTTMSNALYEHLKNKIVIPTGILQGMFFSNDRPQYMIYGGIGSIIGHEIIHGFDNNGRQYDKYGNKVDWWAEETNKHFLEKEKCFIDQYGNYTFHKFGKINGTQMLTENIADNGGLRIAYHAYREWAKKHSVEPRLPGLQQYTPRQMFWLSNANIWCEKSSMMHDRYKYKYSVHSPNRLRIIGPHSNMKEFSDDFRCPIGSNMNPAKKCKLW